VAQDLICQAYPMISAVVEGGWTLKTVVTEYSDDEENNLE